MTMMIIIIINNNDINNIQIFVPIEIIAATATKRIVGRSVRDWRVREPSQTAASAHTAFACVCTCVRVRVCGLEWNARGESEYALACVRACDG